MSIPDKNVKELAKLLERRSGVWIIFGLIIIFLAAGSLNLQIGELALSIGHAPTRTWRAIILLTGLLFLVIGVYLIAHKSMVMERPLVIMLCMFYIFGVIVLYYYGVLLDTNTSPLSAWSYDSENGTVLVELRPDPLQKYKGKNLILIARKYDNNDYRQDSQIEKGHPFPILDQHTPNKERLLNCPSLANKLLPGDHVEIHLLVIPRNINLSNTRSIQEILDKGGIDIQWGITPVAPDFSRLRHMKYLFKHMSDEEKGIISSVACQ